MGLIKLVYRSTKLTVPEWLSMGWRPGKSQLNPGARRFRATDSKDAAPVRQGPRELSVAGLSLCSRTDEICLLMYGTNSFTKTSSLPEKNRARTSSSFSLIAASQCYLHGVEGKASLLLVHWLCQFSPQSNTLQPHLELCFTDFPGVSQTTNW